MSLPPKIFGNHLMKDVKCKKGFTLIELIMTIVVVAIISVPLSLLIVQHYESVFRSKDFTAGINLARLEMEKVNNLSYDAIIDYSLDNYEGFPYLVTRTVGFAAGDDLSPESLKQVVVTVRRSATGNDFVKLITYIAKNVTYGL